MAFNAGYFVCAVFRKKYKIKFGLSREKEQINKKNYVPRYYFIYILAIVCIIYFSIKALPSMTYLIEGRDLGEIRAMIQNQSGNINEDIVHKVINSCAVIIFIPGAALVQLVGIINFWMGKKDKTLLIFSVVLALLSSIAEGGRTSIVNMLFYMIIGYVFSKHKIKHIINSVRQNKKGNHISFVMFILSTFAFITWFTMSRVGNSLYKNLYLYFSMQPYMFHIWAKRVDSLKLFGYGEASLNGFSFAFLYIFKNTLNIDFPAHWKKVYDLIRLTDSEWQVITNINTHANAYVSTFWFFYLDGRLFGIVIGMFAYGIYMAHTYIEAVKNTNCKTVCIFALAIQGMFYIFIRFPFSNIYYAITYMMLISFAFKTEIRQTE